MASGERRWLHRRQAVLRLTRDDGFKATRGGAEICGGGVDLCGGKMVARSGGDKVSAGCEEGSGDGDGFTVVARWGLEVAEARPRMAGSAPLVLMVFGEFGSGPLGGVAAMSRRGDGWSRIRGYKWPSGGGSGCLRAGLNWVKFEFDGGGCRRKFPTGLDFIALLIV
ncbi:hypothetical protein CASFOL_022733 [Castilleja foliolosa]|uniref:Uncharacterized protein n=1 Tax=Castilleja foliolosa TaxID=1961234 RepID=A0ABD3CYS0_9LAMI